jgi:hypothetical protein
MARGLTCTKMGKQMNWAMYAEWTNGEQRCHKSRSSFEQIDAISFDEKNIECTIKKPIPNPLSIPPALLSTYNTKIFIMNTKITFGLIYTMDFNGI